LETRVHKAHKVNKVFQVNKVHEVLQVLLETRVLQDFLNKKEL
jgi:hypothetical protein